MMSEMYAIVVATSKSRSLVLESCMTSPSTRQRIGRPLPPAGNSSGVTSHGPNGVVDSKVFPDKNWVVRRCQSRTVTSLITL